MGASSLQTLGQAAQLPSWSEGSREELGLRALVCSQLGDLRLCRPSWSLGSGVGCEGTHGAFMPGPALADRNSPARNPGPKLLALLVFQEKPAILMFKLTSKKFKSWPPVHIL